MKNSTIAVVGLIALITISCKKEDTFQPVITLNGNYEETVNLNNSYVDAGTTAKDNKDGDISSKIVTTGTVNINEKGEYRLYFDVEDNEGNKASTATRYVTVVNQSDYMIGSYVATPACSGTSTFNTYNTTVSTSETNNQIWIKRVLWQVEDEPIMGVVSGTTIDIPTQTIGHYTIFGSAVLTGENFLVNVTIDDGTSIYTCSIDYLKN